MSASLRQELNAYTVANDIRLNRQQHRGSFLIVEGPDDARLMRKFIDTSCQLVVAFGYDQVSGAIGILEADGLISLTAFGLSILTEVPSEKFKKISLNGSLYIRLN